MFENQKVRRHDKYRNEWSQHWNKCKYQMGQDQVFGGVSVLCLLAAPVVRVHRNIPEFCNNVTSAIRSRSVISPPIGVMSYHLRISMYMVMSQNVI